MHTLQYIAVEADSKQEAFDKVVVSLDRNEEGYRIPDWSDWHVVGGGRWSTNAQKSPDFMGGYNNDPTDVLGYAEDESKFKETLTQIRLNKAQAMNRNIVEIKTDKFISDMVDYASEGGRPSNEWRGDDVMNTYSIKQAAQMLIGSWTPDSGAYDMVEYIAEVSYLQERLDKPEQAMRQYLVPVDFHF